MNNKNKIEVSNNTIAEGPNRVKCGWIVSVIPTLKNLDLTKDLYLVGRSIHCDVVISSTDVPGELIGSISKRHLILAQDPELNKMYLTDLSKNGTFINTLRVERNARIILNDGDKIALGRKDHVIFVYKTDQIEELPDTLTPVETVEYKTEPIAQMWGRLVPCIMYLDSVDIINPVLKVGRSPNCDLNINSMNISQNLKSIFSKEHFVICIDSEYLVTYITDLSKSGTFLNGHLIGKNNKQILQNDDTISIGNRNSVFYVFKCMYSKDLNYLPEELRKKHEVSTLLGRGGAGEVRLAFEKYTCGRFAIKRIVKGRSLSHVYKLNHPSKIQTEIHILKNLSHPFVIKMHEIVETTDEVFIVFDYMKGGELTNRILSNDISEQDVKFLFLQMVLAVQFLHSKGITHRDLKPENVLLDSDGSETIIKVSDFGLSKITEDNELMRTLCGTYCYIAPEVFDTGTPYNRQVDVWSLGVILFYMLSKKLPFYSPDKTKLNALIVEGNYSMSEANWSNISDTAKDLVRKMLTVEPQERITITNILKHPWITTDTPTVERVYSLLDMHTTVSEGDMNSHHIEPCHKRIKIEETIL